MFRRLLILALVLVPVTAWPAQTGEVSPERPAEYMIYQYPGISLIVKIDAPEIQFESRIFGPENALLKSSGVPARRIGPLFQFIDAVDKPRQLMIKVSPDHPTDRSAISMELIQLPERDPNNGALAQAYRFLSSGTELNFSNDTTTWAMKSYTLRNAARAFAALGWEEMRLWSEFSAAHLVLHKLNDYLLAREMAVEIERSASRAGLDMIELAALILEGDTLVSEGAKSSANLRYEQAHAVFDRIVLLADRLDLKSTQARTLFQDGLVYQEQAQTEAAIRQFQRALDVSLEAGNIELANEIRSTAAAAYESRGSASEAIDLLEQIGSDLATEAGQEITDNLFERGRILNSNYRFGEAARELEQALDRYRSGTAGSASWGPVGLALAWSYYSMGEMEQAASLMLESIPRTPQSGNEDALVRGYQSLANIFRDGGDFTRMSLYRGKQGALARPGRQRAEFLFESAMDSWIREGSRSTGIRDLLIDGRREAVAGGQTFSVERFDLYLCLLNVEQKGSTACSTADSEQPYRALQSSGVPWLVLESDFILSKIRHRQGRSSESVAAMETLLEKLVLFHKQLPGVLGSWYWRTRNEMFTQYMSAVLSETPVEGSRPADGTLAFLALNHVRTIESDMKSPATPSLESGLDKEIRELLARREAASGAEAKSLAEDLNGALKRLQPWKEADERSLAPAILAQVLDSLSKDETLLTYYLGDSATYVFLGTRRGISMSKLTASSTLSTRLLSLREGIRGDPMSVLPELESMGRMLLGPVTGAVGKRIYLIPAGALSGFPFQALRLNGRFLAEDHQVINLMNLSATTRFRPVLQQDYREKVFLAGNPQSGPKLFDYEVALSPEISAMTDRFVGPGLHVIQGVALKTDEFQDPRFAGAGLIHLAMPGTIDLVNPERSRLLMSGAGEGIDAAYLSPAQIRGLDYRAGLAVLSHTTVNDGSPPGFENRIGFVSDFLDSNVSYVLASLWVSENSDTAAFLDEFYNGLEAGRDVTAAFSMAGNRRMKSADDANFRSWAGFQLFIR